MDIEKMLQDLKHERDRIQAVIVTLESLSTEGKKRGRPKGAKNKVYTAVVANAG